MEGASVVSSTDWSAVVDALEVQINLATVTGVLATATAACVGLVFMWWGVRKASAMLMNAFRKGKISI